MISMQVNPAVATNLIYYDVRVQHRHWLPTRLPFFTAGTIATQRYGLIH